MLCPRPVTTTDTAMGIFLPTPSMPPYIPAQYPHPGLVSPFPRTILSLTQQRLRQMLPYFSKDWRTTEIWLNKRQIMQNNNHWNCSWYTTPLSFLCRFSETEAEPFFKLLHETFLQRMSKGLYLTGVSCTLWKSEATPTKIQGMFQHIRSIAWACSR